jgi:hypothetical protein
LSEPANQELKGEEGMFSDQVITIAGRTITLTGHDIFMIIVSLVFGVIFWAALYFSRKRVVLLKKSRVTDDLTFELSRIADALERIANRPADRAIASAVARQLPTGPPPRTNSKSTVYSLFGR